MANVHPQLARIKGIALDLLFPKWCIGCGREGSYIYSSCRQLLSLINPPVCPSYGQPEPGGTLCPWCVQWQADTDGIRSPFVFNGVIRKSIQELRYHNLRALAVPLIELLCECFVTCPASREVLVPVPLDRRMWRERRYNQSDLLAHELGKLAGLPIVDDCLTRRQFTPSQARAAGVVERRSSGE